MMALGVGEPPPEVASRSTENTLNDQVFLIDPAGHRKGSWVPPIINWRRCLQQPPWWAWLMIVIGIGVFGLLIVHMVTSKSITSTSLMDTQSTHKMASMEAQTADKVTAFKDCKAVYDSGNHSSGVYTISPDGVMLMDVYCEQQLDGGGWMVFQVRSNGSVDFDRDWYSYRTGFGDLLGEFWLGNENLHHLTKHHDQQLKVELAHPHGEVRYADYTHFWLADETYQYTLYARGYTGGTPPGDSLDHHHGTRFSTKDHNYDTNPGYCPRQLAGGWWYKGCNYSNLNAHYGSKDPHNGTFWYTWKPAKNMIATRMMLRKRR